jgi:tetratricopeptide (TPR) repeat protein
MSMNNRSIWRAALLLGALLCMPTLRAQTLDDVEVSGAGGQAEITIRFAAQVRYQRHVVDPASESVQIFLQVTGEANSDGIIRDTRSSPPTRDLPGFVVRYLAPQGGGPSRRLDVTFDAPVEVIGVGQIGRSADNRSIVLQLKAQEAAPAAQPSEPAAATSTATEPVAMLADAKAALGRQDYDSAIALLNRILNLPPNDASQEAQELIGQVREALGGSDRARAEYQLYLKLYPEGPGADRVRERLAALDLPEAKAVAGGSAPRPHQTTTWGSVSSYYYGGNSRIRTDNIIITPATNATVIDTETLSQVDQSSLVTNIDANARFRGGDWDNRFVVRDIATLSFLSEQPNENRLTSLYGDFRYQPGRLGARLGRQSSTSGSVLGRFDGGSFSWGITEKWRVGAIAGVPAQDVLGNRPNFFALTVDGDTPIEGLGLGFFAVRQSVDGITDRQAIGSELRYFKNLTSVFGLLDYDIQFSKLNVASVQGSWQFAGGGVLNLLYDYRRTPTLQVSNVLLADPTQSLSDLLRTYDVSVLERYALGLTPISKVALAGVTYPVSSRWQLGAELRVSSLTGTDAFGTLPAQPGTGDVYTGTLQAIGTSVFTENGVVTFTASTLSADLYDALLLAANSRFRFGSRWTLEPSIRWYRQDNASGSQLTRLAPTLRGLFQFREHFSLEGEIAYEHSSSDSRLVDESYNILFYYLGFRWDF